MDKDKELKYQDLAWSLKRIEFLLEELLLQTTAERFKNVSDTERADMMSDTVGAVDDKIQSFFQSLPDSK